MRKEDKMENTKAIATELHKRNLPDPLNFLRVAAMMLVFVLHSAIAHPVGIPLTEQPNQYAILFKTPAWAGVWIFVFLSGYVLGKGFYGGKYEMTPKGILAFYGKRLLRILPSYYIFLVFSYFFYTRNFLTSNTDALKALLFLNYNGTPAGTGLGALWYVSMTVILYIFAPMIYSLLSRISSVRVNKAVFVLVLFAGLLLRVSARVTATSWYNDVYVLPAANLDLFICGMVMNTFTGKAAQRSGQNSFRFGERAHKIGNLLVKIAAVVIFLVTVYITSFFYLTNRLSLYRYLMPSVFLAVCAFFVVAFDDITSAKREKLTIRNAARNPLRIIDWLAGLSFEFYMFHSSINATVKSFLPSLQPRIVVEHALFLILGTLCTLVIAWPCAVLSRYVQKFIMWIVRKIGSLVPAKAAPEKQKKIPAGFGAGLMVLLAVLFVLTGNVPAGSSFVPTALSGNGTRLSPYLIATPQDLAQFRDEVNSGISFSGKYVRQTADIDLNAYDNWEPIGLPGTKALFDGVYDGSGYTVSNLKMAEQGNSGLFGTLSGVVMNLGIESGEIQKGNCGGAIASHSGADSALIINCYNKATVHNYGRAGGIADNFNGEVANCVNTGSLSASGTAGIISYTAPLVVNSVSASEPLGSGFKGYRKNAWIASDWALAASRMNETLAASAASTLTDVSLLCRWSYSETEGIHLTQERGIRGIREMQCGMAFSAILVFFLFSVLFVVLKRSDVQ